MLLCVTPVLSATECNVNATYVSCLSSPEKTSKFRHTCVIAIATLCSPPSKRDNLWRNDPNKRKGTQKFTTKPSTTKRKLKHFKIYSER